jgi:HAE1 family hydrophobic/amphiphilic exporter-1
VVVEAVHAKMEQGAKNAQTASISAMNEISGAIIAITLVMSAVFVPVTFIPGSTGVFYKQFGITLAVAIILSAVNALTLSPALCAIFLKPHNQEGHKKNLKQRLYDSFNSAFDAMTGKYRKTTSFFLHKKWAALAVVVVFVVTLGYLLETTPTSFIPEEDTGAFFIDISLPPATSLENTEKVAKQVDEILAGIPEVFGRSTVNGYSLVSGAGSSYAVVICKLNPFAEREEDGQDVNSIIAKINEQTAKIKDARIIAIVPPMVSGFGISGGVEFQLEDKTGGDIKEFERISNEYLAALNQRPEIQYAITSFNTNFPQYEVEVDAARCKQSGIGVSTVLSALQGYMGGYYASDFNRFGKQFRVMLQAEPEYRGNPDDLSQIFVRTSTGEMAPISEFISLKRVYGAETLNRFNMYTSISVTGATSPGYSSGDAIAAVQEVAVEKLPTGYGYEFSGLSKEEIASGNTSIIIFFLCVVFVYFLLAAQYESFILPLSILFSLPVGIAGSFISARIMGVDNNIYLQISLIMLIGLLAKNAILIVEYALQRRYSGMSIMQSAIEGAVARLRPILMTSIAFIVGLMPLVVGGGVGANGNRSIGIGAAGGMLIGTFIGILVVPAMYVIFQTLQEKVKKREKTEISELNTFD